MTDDFSNEPLSITEIRSTRENRGDLATPRDVLIEILRAMDSGALETPEVLVVCMGKLTGPGKYGTEFRCSSPHRVLTLGVLEDVKQAFTAPHSTHNHD